MRTERRTSAALDIHRRCASPAIGLRIARTRIAVRTACITGGGDKAVWRGQWHVEVVPRDSRAGCGVQF